MQVVAVFTQKKRDVISAPQQPADSVQLQHKGTRASLVLFGNAFRGINLRLKQEKPH
jgi:hypothetical protein